MYNFILYTKYIYLNIHRNLQNVDVWMVEDY